MNSRSEHSGGRKKVFQFRTPPGSVPGSLVSDPEAPFPKIHVLAWSNSEIVEKEQTSVSEVGEFQKKMAHDVGPCGRSRGCGNA